MTSLLFATFVAAGGFQSKTEVFKFQYAGKPCRITTTTRKIMMTDKPFISGGLLLQGITALDIFGNDLDTGAPYADDVLYGLTIDYDGFKGSYSNLHRTGYVLPPHVIHSNPLSSSEVHWTGISKSKSGNTLAISFHAGDGGVASAYTYILTKQKALLFWFEWNDEPLDLPKRSKKSLAEYIKYGPKHHHHKKK